MRIALQGFVRSLAIIGFGVLSSCTTVPKDKIDATILQTFDGGDIVTAAKRVGRLENVDNCIYLVDGRRTYVAFFPLGSSVSELGSNLNVPDSGAIELGKTASFMVEFYPTLVNKNANCAGENAFIRSFSGE